MPHMGHFAYIAMNKYYLWVIGCQQNEYEGKRLKFALERSGFVESKPEVADFIIIVACAVRQTAVDRILGKLKVWSDKKIVVIGCVLPKDEIKFKKKNVTVCHDTNYLSLAKVLKIKNVSKFLAFLEQGKESSVFVPIMFGCNNFCSYCAVPYTRGRERSRDFDEVVTEVKKLIGAGTKEITLLGQNVNSYKFGFAKLLKALNDLEGDFIISFTSNHPKDMSDEIIKAVAKLPKIKKEIHLPVQSGSDKILKAMNRPYTIKKYLEIIDRIKKVDPTIKITTDVIVGFPGETEKDFKKTAEVFKKVRYSQAYINKYSPRAGTASYKLGDPILLSEKQRRWHILEKMIDAKK